MKFRDAWLKMFEGAAISRKSWRREPLSAWDFGHQAYVELAKIYKRGSHKPRLHGRWTLKGTGLALWSAIFRI